MLLLNNYKLIKITHKFSKFYCIIYNSIVFSKSSKITQQHLSTLKVTLENAKVL